MSATKTDLLNILNLAADEHELRQWICRWLGCETAPTSSSPPATTSSLPQPLEVVTMQTFGDEMAFPAVGLSPVRAGIVTVTIGGHAGSQPTDTAMLLDTGSFSVVVSDKLAATVGLPQGQALQVSGVNGQSTAYETTLDITIGSHTWTDISGVIMPGYQGMPLIGINFWEQAGLAFFLNPAKLRLSIYPDTVEL
jgi:hypothetical protein